MKKILRNSLLGVATVLGLILLVAAFVDGHIAAQGQVTIGRPRAQVFEYLRMTQHQHEFSVWQKADPNTKMTFSGEDGKVGAVYAWDSQVEEVGKGEQEIVALTDGERIEYELRFERPYEATHKAFFTTADAGSGTVVTWGFEGEMGYPLKLMLLFADMESSLQEKLQQGLDNLKKIMEGMPPQALTPVVETLPADSTPTHP